MTTPRILSVYRPTYYSKDEDSGEFKILVRSNSKDQAASVVNRLYFTHCHCEHDCCGHLQRFVLYHQTKHIKRKNYLVSVQFYRNT